MYIVKDKKTGKYLTLKAGAGQIFDLSMIFEWNGGKNDACKFPTMEEAINYGNSMTEEYIELEEVKK